MKVSLYLLPHDQYRTIRLMQIRGKWPRRYDKTSYFLSYFESCPTFFFRLTQFRDEDVTTATPELRARLGEASHARVEHGPCVTIQYIFWQISALVVRQEQVIPRSLWGRVQPGRLVSWREPHRREERVQSGGIRTQNFVTHFCLHFTSYWLKLKKNPSTRQGSRLFGIMLFPILQHAADRRLA